MKGSNEAKLEKEIKELEELAFGTKDEVKEDEESAETTDSEVTEPTTESPVEETVSTVETPPTIEETKERDWESEYKILRASTDNYKFNTRKELASLRERLVASDALVERLQKSVVVPEIDPFKDTFSKEDAETVGEDALKLMKKAATTAAEAKTKGIKEELTRERKLRLDAEKVSIEDDRQIAIKIFRNKLKAVVPKYSDINLDPAFETFIKAEDPINGGSRLQYFKSAERAGNVKVVAEYMREFLGTKAPQDSLEERVAPTGAPVAETNGESKVVLIPVSEVDKFYADISKGKYKGKHSLQVELEAKYDLAFSKGGVDYMR